MVKSNKRTYSSKSRKRISKGGSRKRISKGGSRKRILKGGSRKRILKGGAANTFTLISVDGKMIGRVIEKKGLAQDFYPALKILSESRGQAPKQTFYMRNYLVEKLPKAPSTYVEAAAKTPTGAIEAEEPAAVADAASAAAAKTPTDAKFQSYLDSKFDLYYDSLGEGSGWSKIFFRYNGKRYPYEAIKRTASSPSPSTVAAGGPQKRNYNESLDTLYGLMLKSKKFKALVGKDKYDKAVNELVEAYYDYAFFEKLYLESRDDIYGGDGFGISEMVSFFDEEINSFLRHDLNLADKDWTDIMLLRNTNKKEYLYKLAKALYRKCLPVEIDPKGVIKGNFKTFFENQVALSLIVTSVEGKVINTAGGNRTYGFSIDELKAEKKNIDGILLSNSCQLVGLTGIRGETDVSSQLNEWSLLLNFGAVAATVKKATEADKANKDFRTFLAKEIEVVDEDCNKNSQQIVEALIDKGTNTFLDVLDKEKTMFSELEKDNFKEEFNKMVRVRPVTAVTPDGTSRSYPTQILTARINYVIDTSIEVAKNFLATKDGGGGGEADAPSASPVQVPVLSLTGAGLGEWSNGFFEKLLKEGVIEQVQADYKKYVTKYNIYKGIQMLREIMKDKKIAVLKYPWSFFKYEDFESLVQVINEIDGAALTISTKEDIGGGFFCILTETAETPEKKIYVEFGSAASFNLSVMEERIKQDGTPNFEFKVSSQFAWDGGINPIGNEFLMGKFMASGDPQAAAAIDNYKSII